MTTTNIGAASLSDAFETLIDIYQDAQNGGTTEQRVAARGALKAAFKSALMCSSASRAAPTPQADAAPSAFQSLKDALHADSDYAWGWHCNLAMPIMDSIHCTPEQANKAGADLMKFLFDIDVRKFAEWHHAAPLPREAATVTEGYAVVPVVMTAAMINAWSGGRTVSSDEVAARTPFQDAWKRVLAAASNGEQK